jgi:hypothetical protein
VEVILNGLVLVLGSTLTRNVVPVTSSELASYSFRLHTCYIPYQLSRPDEGESEHPSVQPQFTPPNRFRSGTEMWAGLAGWRYLSFRTGVRCRCTTLILRSGYLFRNRVQTSKSLPNWRVRGPKNQGEWFSDLDESGCDTDTRLVESAQRQIESELRVETENHSQHPRAQRPQRDTWKQCMKDTNTPKEREL